MNRARIIVLTIAIGAGGVAAYLASGSDSKPPPQEPVAQLPTVDVLVAKADINLGQTVTPNEMQWQTWPAATASSAFIRQKDRPDAMKEITGSIARSPFIAGEPIREPKLIKAEGSGFMAAILPQGMRAISTEISAETGAGGFILPNDRVDVILTRREKNPDPKASGDLVVPEVIFTNIRVLAIDQAPKEKDGQNSVLGKTATLELKPEQVPLLAAARQAGVLSLALRSIADVNQVEVAVDDRSRQRSNINVVRYGVTSSTQVQK
ncbi:Flp pilus assembly protein CpaB [Bradyrhizobium sp.]|jgi:pilus assembly protein CpaB|uniref:Flp pilus assembly protein CpaB n=1 Tax=Bradyrhizobium sp. TaxID=376 RepID=UPI002D5DCEAF|nr:Flp pilus assembly protein CpaB [Bradyrhizobium sp.]HZR71332.1 Flp pilus assembly protein CpaB [Bradyrhizobium sp.]